MNTNYTEKVKEIIEQWEKNPLPESYVNFDPNDPTISKTGLIKQIEHIREKGLSSGNLVFSLKEETSDIVKIHSVKISV